MFTWMTIWAICNVYLDGELDDIQCLPGWRVGRYVMFTWMASWTICNLYLDGELGDMQCLLG